MIKMKMTTTKVTSLQQPQATVNISIWLKTNSLMLKAIYRANYIIYAWTAATMLEVSQLYKNLGHINGTIALWKTAQVLNIPGLMKTKTELLKQEAGATIHAKPLEDT